MSGYRVAATLVGVRITWDRRRRDADYDAFRAWLATGLPRGIVYAHVPESWEVFIGRGLVRDSLGSDIVDRMDVPDVAAVGAELESLLASRALWTPKVARSLGLWLVHYQD